MSARVVTRDGSHVYLALPATGGIWECPLDFEAEALIEGWQFADGPPGVPVGSPVLTKAQADALYDPIGDEGGPATLPDRLSEAALSAMFVRRWQASTGYNAGELVLNPVGQVVSANATFTSGTTYSASNWTVVNSSTGGTTAAILSTQTALAKFYGNLALRDSQPVIVYVEGDSYSQSFSASYWPDRLSARLQAAYPKLTGTSPAPTTDTATARSSRGTGVQIVNGATGGSTSGNWFDATAAAAVAALQPALYILMVGTNDVANGITPAQHKTNLQNLITYQQANNPRPCAFVIVHPFKRMDQYQAGWSPWEDYATVEREIAAADPSNVVAVDLAPAFALVGVPGTDPLDLVGSDNLHPNEAGHAYIEDLIWQSIRPQAALAASGAASPIVATAPGQVVGLAGTPTVTTVPLTWTATTGATSYKVEHKATSGSTWTVDNSAVSTSSYTVTGLTASTSYDFRVTASNSAGPGTVSATLTVSTTSSADTTAPTVPTGLTAGTPTATSVPLSWTASTDAVGVTGYRVYRGGTLVGSPTTTSYTDTGLAASTAYSYTVSAVDAAGNESAQTSAVNATTAAAVAGALTDSFNRADSTTSLGTPSDGGAAYLVNGTWGIAGNAAYQSGSESNAYAIRPLGSTAANASVTAVIGATATSKSCLFLGTTTGGGTGYILFLGLGSSNDFQLWRVSNGNSYGGGQTFGNVTTAIGDTIKLEKVGSTFKIYQNGSQVYSALTDATYSTVTHGGIWMYQANNTVRFDSLSIAAG